MRDSAAGEAGCALEEGADLAGAGGEVGEEESRGAEGGWVGCGSLGEKGC